MKFVNCTPHALTVRGLGTIAPSGIVPRCATVRTPDTAIEGVRVTRQTVVVLSLKAVVAAADAYAFGIAENRKEYVCLKGRLGGAVIWQDGSLTELSTVPGADGYPAYNEEAGGLQMAKEIAAKYMRW